MAYFTSVKKPVRLSDGIKNLTLLGMTVLCLFVYVLPLFWEFFLLYFTLYKAPIMQFLLILVSIIEFIFKDLTVFVCSET